MESENELQISWLNFIAEFTDEKIDKTEKKIKTGDFRFEIKNFLSTGINLNDSYGFLTLDFRHKSCKWNVQDFISATQITFKSKKSEKMTLQWTNQSPEYYPCRIYGADNKGRIRFYRSDDITDFDELLNSYITVFQSVMFAIIRLKINLLRNNKNNNTGNNNLC